MDPPLILIIVLTFAFAATHLERAALGGRTNLFASLEYVLIGVLVGPLGLSFLDAERLDSLEPLLAVVTGFVGFLVGLSLDFRRLRDRPAGTLTFGLVIGVVCATLVGGLAWVALTYLPDDALAELPTGAVVLAAATLGLGAIITAVESLESGILAAHADGPVSRLLPTAAQTLRVVAIIGFGLALASDRSPGEVGALPVVWDLIAIGAGLGLAVIFHVFVGNEQDANKLFVATIGVVALASGVAHALHFSPLFVNLVVGATIANVSRAAPALLRADTRLRRPLFVVLLLLAGAGWSPLPGLLWVVPIGYLLVRAIALRLGAQAAVALTAADIDADTPHLGDALLGQGALAAAVAVNFAMVSDHGTLTAVVVTTLLVGAALNDIWYAPALRGVLQTAGESGRREGDRPTPHPNGGGAEAPPSPGAEAPDAPPAAP
ncbi:MAG: hypothetical protein EP329_05920 [Deltaproteobacteria bacterium]|nr:MAG: hypothetical protein EP329_05920 [Deltaproteobacteria bacterium]